MFDLWEVKGLTLDLSVMWYMEKKHDMTLQYVKNTKKTLFLLSSHINTVLKIAQQLPAEERTQNDSESWVPGKENES